MGSIALTFLLILPVNIVARISGLLGILSKRTKWHWLAIIATDIDYRMYQDKSDKSTVPSDRISNEVKELNEELGQQGLVVCEGYWSVEKCNEAIQEIDRLIRDYPYLRDKRAKSDLRFYGANKYSDILNDFNGDPMLQQLSTLYNQVESRAAFTLAARMDWSPNNLGSGEGWHRDAFFRQFKAILYLSDVANENGPFEIIEQSYKRDSVLKDINLAKLGYMDSRISDAQIDSILTESPERLRSFTAKAGTLILVDTSSIHRGKPMENGSRYALTNYYYPQKQINQELYKKFGIA